MANSNFDVFLETLNKGLARSPSSPPGAVGTFQIGEAAPVLTALVDDDSPQTLEALVSKTKLKITPLVLTLQQLAEYGFVAHDTERETYTLTNVGRQMLAVAKMVR